MQELAASQVPAGRLVAAEAMSSRPDAAWTALVTELAAGVTLEDLGPRTVLLSHGATWTLDTSARTEAQVRAAWAVLQPTYSGSAYAVVPSVVAFCAQARHRGHFPFDLCGVHNRFR